jgi:DnaJ family protein C protein 28
MSPQRRDAEGHRQTAHSWESLVERQIREAMEAGAFDEVPYRGERIPLEDDAAAGDWAMAHRMLRNAGMAPPWIESDKESRRLLAEIEATIERGSRTSPLSRARERTTLTRLVEEANRAIDRVNAEAPTLRQHRRRLDPAEQLDRLERAFAAA